MSRKELETEIQAMLDGMLEDERIKGLETILLEDPEARELYLSYARLHCSLGLSTVGKRTAETWGVVPMKRIVSLQRQRGIQLAIAASIMLTLFSGILLWWRMAPNLGPLHAYQASSDAKYAVIHPEGETAPEGNFLRTGSRLKLREGKIECWIHEGVHAIIKGPAELTVRGEKEVFLGEGIAWFNVAKGAEGFTVVTPDAEVVDLGTEFGVIADPSEDDEAHVFAGKVRLTNLRKPSEARLLKAGDGYSVDDGGNYGRIRNDSREIFADLTEDAKMPAPSDLRHRPPRKSVFAAPPSHVKTEVFTAGTGSQQGDDWLQSYRTGVRFTSSRDFLSGNPGLLTNAPGQGGEMRGAAPSPEGIDDTRWDFVLGPAAGENGFTLTGITVHGALTEEVSYGLSRGDLDFAVRFSTVSEPRVFRSLLPREAYVNPAPKEGEGVRVSISMQFPLREVHTLRFVINGSPSRDGRSSSYAEIDVNGFPSER